MARSVPEKAAQRPRPRATSGVTFDTVRALALALAGVEESTSYGTPAFKVGKKLLVRLREDGETLVLHVAEEARELLMSSDPEAFFITDHYAGYPAVLVRLPRVTRAAFAMVLEESWRSLAPRRLVDSEARPSGGREATRATKKPGAKPASAFSRLRSICLALAEVTEVEKHGHPCFAVRDKTFVMFMDNHHGDGRLAIWCKAPPGAQAALVESDPARFFVPPYLGPRGWVGARLDVNVDWSAIAACVEESYQMSAPKPRAAKRPRT